MTKPCPSYDKALPVLCQGFAHVMTELCPRFANRMTGRCSHVSSVLLSTLSMSNDCSDADSAVLIDRIPATAGAVSRR